MNLKRIDNTINGWLVNNFDVGSCLLRIDFAKEFLVTEYDVYDVFSLPLNVGNPVKDISRDKNKNNPLLWLKEFWRDFFGCVEVNAQIDLP